MTRIFRPPPTFGILGLVILWSLVIGHWSLVLSAQPLQWQQGSSFRVASVAVSQPGRTGFTLLTNAQLGIQFTNFLAFERSAANQNLLNGAGLATGDYDGDGWCDVYFCNLGGRNALCRNLGEWTFADVTDQAGVACAGRSSTGATFADVNGDGWLDLIVTANGSPNVVFVNDGKGRFTEVPLPPGLVTRTGSTSIALADIDGDGDLDLYITNYGENSILRSGGTVSTRIVGGKEEVVGRYRNRIKLIDGKMFEYGEPDVLYVNDGKGNFAPVSWTDGHFLDEDGKPLSEAPWDEGLSVQFRDINGDGAPDIYVCNDFQTPDRIWINDGKGHFRAIGRLALRQTCNFAMCVDLADINRDGLVDLFVADMLSRYHELRMKQMDGAMRVPRLPGFIDDRPQVRRNMLYLNRGDGTFAEIANHAGLDASDWTWTLVFLDVDLDGWEDVVTGNGHGYDTQDLDTFERTQKMGRVSAKEKQETLKWYPLLPTPNMIFHNRGNLKFEETGSAWGYDSRQVTHAIALADFDNDGDLDLALNCLNAPPLVYCNSSDAPRIGVRLKGRLPNVQGVGATIMVRGGAVPMQSQEVISGGHYVSGSDPMRVFAAGTMTNDLTVEVSWRSGRRSVVQNAKANRLYEVDEGGAGEVQSPKSKAQSPAPAPLFRDVSERLAHAHMETEFNDYERQPLLHKNYSQLGPAVAWFDLDGDGHDDLIIGSGRGGKLGMYRGDGKGVLSPWPGSPWKEPAGDDLTGIVGWTPAPGQRALLVGLANYESAENTPSVVLRYDAAALTPHSSLRTPQSSFGPLAVADIDGDGDLDLFVGGRVVAGRYPEAAASFIYRNNDGTLELDGENGALLKQAGLVSGAVWADLNGDGLPELVLAVEWGPLRVFQNSSGRLNEVTAQLGLDKFFGWWSGVNAGDFDGDGQLDLVAANWGLNSSYYQPKAEHPLRLYFGDFDGNGTVDLLEAYSDATGKFLPRRDLLVMGAGLPTLRTRLPTHGAYAKAEASAVIGEAFSQAQLVQANTLASMVFLNRRGKFEPVPLPVEAQLAPAFGVNVADFDGDGHEDVFLSQNFFAMRAEEPRLDAGRGLWLRGDGAGRFTAVPGQETGIKVYGEQRGSAVGDFDEDGRVDLVVTQNGAATKLYRNEQARPGVRIRLRGSAANPQGIGATVRMSSGQKPGPVREIHGGSGYWSQDSAVTVLATPQAPTTLVVRWPGGRTTTHAIPANAREVVAALEETRK